jgi:hypothetical protein
LAAVLSRIEIGTGLRGQLFRCATIYADASNTRISGVEVETSKAQKRKHLQNCCRCIQA